MTQRVLIDSRMAESAGIGTYIVNLVPLVAARLPDVAFTLLGQPDRLEALGLLQPANITAARYQRRLYGLTEWLGPPRQAAADILWVPHFNVPLHRSRKLLVTVHDTFHLALPELMHNRLQASYAKLRYRIMKARADRIITVSEFSRSELSRLLGIEPRRIEVIPLGVDDSWRRAGDGQETDPPHIVFVGSVKPHKNVRVLIEAFRSIQDRVPHELLLIGSHEGMLTPDEAVLHDQRHVEDRVRFLGRVSKSDLIECVRSADALVHPSLYEGFGLTPLEAMACGCPTVVSSAASLPEVCGDASVYFDPRSPGDLAETLFRVLSDPDLRDELIVKGHVRSDAYAWSATADQTARVIRSMLPTRTGPAS